MKDMTRFFGLLFLTGLGGLGSSGGFSASFSAENLRQQHKP